MLPNQRHLFDLPDDVAYLNCAYTSPLLRSAREAGERAVREKSRPWSIVPADFFELLEANRDRFSRIVHASADDIAIVPAASYGIAIAAGLFAKHSAGRTIVLLEEQFPSNVNSWLGLASARDATVHRVSRPADGNWTRDVLAAIDERTAVAALPHCHWTDGSRVDLEQIGRRCREVGAVLVVDGTQSIGAMPFDVRSIQPDLVVAAAHKWLLGPYSYGYCYVAPRWQDGKPLEENWLNRAGSEDFSALTAPRDEYRTGARRFDVGEASNFMLAPIAAAALDQLLEWSVEEIAATLGSVTDRIARRAGELGFRYAPAEHRSPHMIGIRAPGGLPAGLSGRLAARSVYVSVRGNAIRIAPHVYTGDADLDRLFTALRIELPT